MNANESKRFMAPGLVALAAICSYAPGILNAFISDDGVLLEARLTGYDTLAALVSLGGESYWDDISRLPAFRPFGLIWLGLMRLLFGLNPVGYHLVSLALHAACSLAAWRLVRQWVEPPIAMASALLFALHPLHAEAVLPAYGQSDLITSLLVLVGLEWYILSARSGWAWRPLAASAAACFVALGFKESGAVLPILAVLVRLTMLSDLPLPRRIVEWAYGVPIAAYAVWRLSVLGFLTLPEETTVVAGASWFDRVKLLAASHSEAIRLVLFPWRQSVAHAFREVWPGGVPWGSVAWIFIGLLLTGYLARLAGARRAAWIGGWFLITFLPVSNIVPFGAFVPERSLYLSVLALTWGLAWAAAQLSPAARRVALGVLALAYGTLSFRLCRNWSDETRLWVTIAADYPSSPVPQLRAGLSLLNELDERSIGEPAAVARIRSHFDRARELGEAGPELAYGLGVTAAIQGDCATARPALEAAAGHVVLFQKLNIARERCGMAAAVSTPEIPRRP